MLLLGIRDSFRHEAHRHKNNRGSSGARDHHTESITAMSINYSSAKTFKDSISAELVGRTLESLKVGS
jgi:hypothetical protein